MKFVIWGRLYAVVALVSAVCAGAGSLNVSFSSISTGSVVNLTTNGALDWVHWGLFTETSIDRKGGVIAQISDFTVTYDTNNSNAYAYVYQFSDNRNGYSWSDGTPHMAVTNTTTGVWAYGIPNLGSGFQFTVPASTNTRTLRAYVGVFAGAGKFTAALSDNSAPPFTSAPNTTLSNLTNGPSAVYTISFAADSTGQTLTLRYTLQSVQGPHASQANVTLQSAALTAPGANNLPYVALTSPAEGTSVTDPTNITLTADASDADGSVTLVEFYDGATKLGDVAAPPYTFIWTNPAPGRHSVAARAIDNLAGVGESLPVTVFVAGTGGSLAGTRATPPTSLNLTTEGTSDWTHWGFTNASDFNHKASGGGQISNFTRIGTNTVKRYTDNRTAFSWTDGTPVTSVANTNVGVFITGVTNGFQITAPADTNMRTLRVYVGLYGAQGNLQAWLTDFSGRAFTDTTLSNVFGNSYAVYALTYAAATNGQHLVVRYTLQNLYDFDFGNVTLQAATLQGFAALSPVQLRDPQRYGNSFVFSFLSQQNQSYAAQFTSSLSPVSWQTFTNVPGNGGGISVTDQVDSASQRFYRVLTQ